VGESFPALSISLTDIRIRQFCLCEMSYVRCTKYVTGSNIATLVYIYIYFWQAHKEQASQIDVLEMKTRQVDEV
jgi:hypothetical protein